MKAACLSIKASVKVSARELSLVEMAFARLGPSSSVLEENFI